MTFRAVEKLLLRLDDVEARPSYGTPGFRVGGRLFARLRDDLDALVIRTTFEERDRLIAGDGDVFFLVDHYRKHPWVLVRLSTATPALMRRAIARAHALAASEAPKTRTRSV